MVCIGKKVKSCNANEITGISLVNSHYTDSIGRNDIAMCIYVFHMTAFCRTLYRTVDIDHHNTFDCMHVYCSLLIVCILLRTERLSNMDIL